MKKYILRLFLISSFYCFAQNLTVHYVDEAIYPNNPENNFSFNWNLSVSGGISLYSPAEEIKNVEKPTTVVIEGETIETTGFFYYNYEIYYLDREKNTQTLQIRNKDTYYLVTEPLQILEWKILEETKQIDKYTCRAAIAVDARGYEIKAWYTTEIPISLGPAKYVGLPGLVLEVYMGFKHYVAKGIKFDLDSEIEVPTEGIVMTRKEYDIHREEMMPKNRSETKVEQEGNTTITTKTVHKVEVLKAPKNY